MMKWSFGGVRLPHSNRTRTSLLAHAAPPTLQNGPSLVVWHRVCAPYGPFQARVVSSAGFHDILLQYHRAAQPRSQKRCARAHISRLISFFTTFSKAIHLCFPSDLSLIARSKAIKIQYVLLSIGALKLIIRSTPRHGNGPILISVHLASLQLVWPRKRTIPELGCTAEPRGRAEYTFGSLHDQVRYIFLGLLRLPRTIHARTLTHRASKQIDWAICV